MEHIADQGKKTSAYALCGTAEGHYRRKKWCGSFLVLVGLLWLSVCAGWLDADLFGPVLLMLMGTWIILPPVLRRMTRGEDRTGNS